MDLERARAIEAEAIASCDRDPIHAPEAIQSFGSLIGIDVETERIVYASGNLENFVESKAESVLGKSALDLFTLEQVHALRNVLGHPTSTELRERAFTVSGHTETLDASVHRVGQLAIVELQALRGGEAPDEGALARVRWLLTQVDAHTQLDERLREAAVQFRMICGYDRVMVYRFRPDDSGEVVAEARSSELDPFLGLRFPAYDIPPQARALYARMPIRVIADIGAEDAPVRSSALGAPPLDLSLALLRATHPVHLQYLRNMGSWATMTIPIFVEGKLWGLFAAHHASPREPSPDAVVACELAGRLLGLIIEQSVRHRRDSLTRKSMTVASSLVAVDDSELSSSEYWARARVTLQSMIPSDGIAYLIDEAIETYGACPPRQSCFELRDWAEKDGRDLIAFEALSQDVPGLDFGEAAGALIMSLFPGPRIHLMYFRREVSKTVTWAGTPDKDIQFTDAGIRLHPRSSFAAFKQTVEGQSDSWENDDIIVAESIRGAMRSAIVAQRQLKDNRHRLGLLVRELNHRVRNILALIQSMASRTTGSARSVSDYALSLERRIVALARAHDLLTQADVTGVSVRALAEAELRPFLGDDELQHALSGPEVQVTADAASVLALVVHELTSNAVKYGALSVPSRGQVRLTWRLERNGVSIFWSEAGGPPVAPPQRAGFGRSILENAVRYEFDGECELRFDPAGVRASFWFPPDTLHAGVPVAEATDRAAPPVVGPSAGSPPQRGRVLLVEDNFVIATDLTRMLEELGFGAVDGVPSVDRALRMLEQNRYDLCVIDLNLRGQLSRPVADRVRQLGYPFVFVTGYGSGASGITGYEDVATLKKPLSKEVLETFLEELDRRAAGASETETP